MRNKTFISSMVGVAAAVAVAGSASAGIAGMTFDSFTVAQSESNLPDPIPGINWASPASSQPIFGASGTRAAYAFNYGSSGTTTTSSVSSGAATFTTNAEGGAVAGLQYFGNAQDLTGYTFSFYLNSNVPTAGQEGFSFFLQTAGLGTVERIVNYTGAGTYTVNANDFAAPEIDLTAITSFGFGIYTSTPGTATVSNFTYTPAPGAIALLGAAGLVGARRRRA